jgi:inosose dehydratase
MNTATPNLRWAYMDHWRVDSPQGYVSQYSSISRLDSFLKQIAALGFEAIETFDFHLPVLIDLFGSLPNARAFLQERGACSTPSCSMTGRRSRICLRPMTTSCGMPNSS